MISPVDCPECPYCGKETIAFFMKNNQGSLELFWGCNCTKIKELEKMKTQAEKYRKEVPGSN